MIVIGNFSTSKANNLAINRAIYDLARAMAREAIHRAGSDPRNYCDLDQYKLMRTDGTMETITKAVAKTTHDVLVGVWSLDLNGEVVQVG